MARLELAALRSRTVRATKLRYTPITMCFVSICCGAFGSASRISVRSCALNNRFGDMFLFLKCTSFDSLNFSQTKLRYTPIILDVVNFDCFCNIHQFAYFCNKNESIILKIMFYAIIFLSRCSKSIAKPRTVIYNNVRDGAWCSGSTWASDSHCVGSIPIAPANANTLTCEGVSFILPHFMLA